MPSPLLTGQGSPNRGAGSEIVWVVVGLALVLAVGAWRFRPRPAVPAPPPMPAVAFTPAPATALAAPLPPQALARNASEDLRLHMGHAQQQLVVAAEQLAAARRVLAALSPDLNRNYLQLQKRRAEAAGAACEAAQQAVEHALDELTVITPKDKE